MLGTLTAGLFFVLLIWGNLVAGMHAGMACPDWPLCQGNVLPPLRLDVWMEFLHRVLAALATLLLVLLTRQRLASYRGWQRAVPILALALVALEIGLGAVVVLLELPVQPTTIHFMIALAVFLLVLYLAANDGSNPAPVSFSGYAAALFCITLLVFSQASLGAYLRHSAAGLACPDFPTCRGEWIPRYWDAPTITNLSHRLLGLGTLGSVFLLYLASLLDRRLKERRPQFFSLAVLVAVQICVGIATVRSGLSYPITSLHLALTLTIIGFSLRLWLAQREPSGLT
ncbi:cytochrome oxidase assembly protein [Geomonas limicola]|uniref:Cytochrome oxidase assembly protein n=1 Tax=Geomonas limicola TaxID=2740186 RepID=A0A6V8NDV7_9BACT|nr:COX15/CtaA family protein [Geomonas limicola]GFO69753.1 cytochrome oxidase assembly protein [Geomonas limicola]